MSCTLSHQGLPLRPWHMRRCMCSRRDTRVQGMVRGVVVGCGRGWLWRARGVVVGVRGVSFGRRGVVGLALDTASAPPFVWHTAHVCTAARTRGRSRARKIEKHFLGGQVAPGLSRRSGRRLVNLGQGACRSLASPAYRLYAQCRSCRLLWARGRRPCAACAPGKATSLEAEDAANATDSEDSILDLTQAPRWQSGLRRGVRP